MPAFARCMCLTCLPDHFNAKLAYLRCLSPPCPFHTMRPHVRHQGTRAACRSAWAPSETSCRSTSPGCMFDRWRSAPTLWKWVSAGIDSKISETFLCLWGCWERVSALFDMIEGQLVLLDWSILISKLGHHNKSMFVNKTDFNRLWININTGTVQRRLSA